MFGSEPIPASSFAKIYRNPEPILAHPCHIILRVRVPLFGKGFQPCQGQFIILGTEGTHALAVLRADYCDVWNVFRRQADGATLEFVELGQTFFDLVNEFCRANRRIEAQLYAGL